MPRPVHDARRRALALTGLTAVLAAPATLALAAAPAVAPTHVSPVALTAPQGAGAVIVAHLDRAAHTRALRSTTRTARHLARARGRRLTAGHRRALERRSVGALVAIQIRLRRSLREARRTGGAARIAIPAQLQAIAACESGGNPGAIGGGGAYRGKYQFSLATWAAVGGHGDPAAAPEVEQDRRAAMLYARSGAGQWPVCGR